MIYFFDDRLNFSNHNKVVTEEVKEVKTMVKEGPCFTMSNKGITSIIENTKITDNR